MKPPVALLCLGLAACEPAPSYLRPSGYIGDRQATLGWILLVIAMAVVVIVGVLVVAAVYHRRRADMPGQTERELQWIFLGGIVVPTVILLGVLIFSLTTLAAVASPPKSSAITIQVIGHRWWWEVRYPGKAPAEMAATANEIHLPVRQPVRLELTTADVIHSFWIPQLAGKTDLIPGQRNVAWIEADTAGTYWGHCGEYCGLQHANMMLTVVAEPAADFERWLETQRGPAAEPSASAPVAGRDVFGRAACSLCHTIRGTEAGGNLGPDLTHLASRHSLAAGTLRNTEGNLFGWIAGPQALKPGAGMPAVPLSPDELHALVSYLQTLK